MIKPDRLQLGDTVGIVAPASAPPNPAAIDQSIETVQRLGFRPKLGTNARRRWGFLAGSDRERAADLMAMFIDRRVKALVCVRGGYGTPRLLPLLDYELIRRHPKILVGYSDISALHSALIRKAGLVCFHGPMFNSDFIKPDCPEFTVRSFLRAVSVPKPAGSVLQGYTGKTMRPLGGGAVTGRLVGGNLTLLCATLGTPFQPLFKGRILFFEDLDEPPYRFDRMLTQLLQAGLLRQVAGIAVGINKGCRDPKARKSQEYRQTLEEVLCERLLPLKVPIVLGLPFGHVSQNATLPIGCRARLDGNRGDLEILESAVR